jgi:hypothetical protein
MKLLPKKTIMINTKRILTPCLLLAGFLLLYDPAICSPVTTNDPGRKVENEQSGNTIPYLATLENSKITTESLNSPTQDAMIQGNGDIHSLFYAREGKITLRLAKNDVYDARIDTSEDPELATIDIATGKTSRELTIPPSWDKPYPLSINFANILIDYSGKQLATIDILRSFASINEGEIIIRPLLQDNVYHIQTRGKVTLEGQPWFPVPPAHTGETNGIRWVRQELPGDDSGDWKGMSVVTALASAGDHHFAAVVTSLETKDPMRKALAMAAAYSRKDTGRITAEHEKLWREFWQRSGIQLSNREFNEIWYQNMYFSRCAQNPRSQAIGLFIGPLLDPPEGWHDNYTINYNFQQTFWSFFVNNHVNYADPYIKVVADYLPRAKWFARQTYGIEGAFYPHNIYRHEPPDPEKCKSGNNRMFAGGPWGYTIGLSGYLIHNLWLSYRYYPDEKNLRKIYPVIKEVARFYVNFCKQCSIGDNGMIRLGPTVSPEHMPFGVYDCPFDIAFLQFSFRVFLEASEKLSADLELAGEVQKYLTLMPDHPVHEESGVIVDRENGKPIEYNIPVPITPVFPAEQVTYFSPGEEKKLFSHTLDHIETNENNSTIMLAVSKARLSTPDAMAWLEEALRVRRKPNGSLRFSTYKHFDGYGHYTEMFAAAGAISELLLQSVDDIIRVFPAWPKDKDAGFSTLRTSGGFLVSAKLEDREITELEISSGFGETLRLLSPWKKIYLNGTELQQDEKGIVTINTEKGKSYQFSSGSGNNL